MNKLTLVGNVVATPTLRKVNTNSGETSVIDFRIAVNNLRNREKVTYVKATAWRGLAETVAKYVTKGQKLFIAGPADVEAYIDKQGNPRAQLTMQVEDFEFAGSPARAAAPEGNKAVYAPQYDAAYDDQYSDDEENDDLPF